MKFNKFLPIILLLAANLIYGINYSVAKYVLPDYIKPYGFVVLRSLSAVFFYWLFSFFIKESRNAKLNTKEKITLFACGLFGVAINQLNFFKGLEFTGPISASILMITVPIMVLILSFFILKNPITKYKLSGIIIGLIGAITIILSQGGMMLENAQNPTLGNTLIFINATSYALYLILAKPLLEKFHPIFILKWMFTAGLIISLPFGYQQLVEVKWNTFTTEVYLAVGFVLIFVSVFTYLFNLYALKRVNPSTVSVFIYSQPLFAISLSLYLGNDVLNIYKIIGSILIFLGVYFVLKPQIKTM